MSARAARVNDADAAEAVHGGAVKVGAGRTHWAHVAVVSLHSLCCGIPLVLSSVGLAASVAWSGWAWSAHAALHDREWIVLLVSLALVLAGAFAERDALRRRRVSLLFAASCVCFVANVAVVGAHRLTVSPQPAHTECVRPDGCIPGDHG